MSGGLLALVIAAIGAAYATLVWRAAPNRRDNVVFGALALTDALMTAWRGLNVLAGGSIIGPSVTLACSIGTVVLALLSVELLASFPRRPGMRRSWRLALWAWSAFGVGLVLLVDIDHMCGHAVSELAYFAPSTALIFLLGVRAWVRTPDRDARIVIAALLFRWATGFSAYCVAPALGVFEAAVWGETLIASTVSFVVIGTTVLRSDLFSLRSVAAEAVTMAMLAFVVIASGATTVNAVLSWTAPGTLQGALLVGATLVPLAVARIGQALYPRVERRVLAGLDERRARRLGMRHEPLPAGADAALAEAVLRIAAIGDGAMAVWHAAASLPAGLAARLGDTPHRRDDDPTLPACLVVPAFGAERAVVGAFYIDGGTIDRDTFVVARDLAAHVALAVERAAAITALEEARQLAALGQFAAAIAHDIRTPLTSISLNVQILRRKLALAPDDAEHLDIALEELRRLDRSVAEILDFAKPVRLAREALDVHALLAEAARGLSPVWSDRGVGLRCEPAAGDALPEVCGDTQRLRQVLTNLVDNAAEASPAGAEVTLRAARAQTGDVHIDVVDRGRGIDARDLARIFDPFFTTRADGTGLGLAICHKVVAAHGGELRVQSALGQGSTFTIVLPARS